MLSVYMAEIHTKIALIVSEFTHLAILPADSTDTYGVPQGARMRRSRLSGIHRVN